MSISVEDAIMVEDVTGRDETLEKILKADLFALGEVSGRHIWCGYVGYGRS
jgi:hypothetical protein